MNSIRLFLILLTAPLVGHAQSNSYLREMASQLENAKKYTVQIAQAMPEDKYGYKPAADEMSFRAQLLHICQNIEWLTGTHLTTQPAPVPESSLKDAGQSKAEVEQSITQAFDYAIASVRAFDATNLEQKVNFFAGPLSKRQMINLANDHQVHHRGQLIVYLRLNNVKPPAYIGW